MDYPKPVICMRVSKNRRSILNNIQSKPMKNVSSPEKINSFPQTLNNISSIKIVMNKPSHFCKTSVYLSVAPDRTMHLFAICRKFFYFINKLQILEYLENVNFEILKTCYQKRTGNCTRLCDVLNFKNIH